MDRLKLEKFYAGHCLEAYELFGAHLCFEGRRGARFTIYAPHALSIQVIGSFNDWSCEGWVMKPADESGVYSLFIPDVKHGDMYKYRVTQTDGRIVDKMDPYAFHSELRPNTASIVTDLDFHWHDEKWMKKRDRMTQQAINIYEVHIGSWKQKEDGSWYTYREIAKDLIAYVKAQHFTHLEFMPLNEYPFDGSWGYQCSGYYAATSRFGTCEDLMFLIDQCHKAGIGVILDFVPVHFVRDDFSLSYFDGSPLYEYQKDVDANSQWGTSNFDLWSETVRSFLMSAASFWLDIYHIDGLRMDAISNIIYWHGNRDNGVNEGALAFIRRMNYNLHRRHPGAILIAEDSSDFPNVTKSTLDMGLGFDYKWDLGWMNDTLKYMGLDPIYRKWHHNQITFSMAYFYSEKFLLPLSHDEVVHGKKTIIDKMWGTYEEKFAQLRTLYMYMFTHPGKKLNFMGNELAHFREWDESKENDWFLLDYPVHDAFHHYFAKLGEYYTSIPALYENDYSLDSFQWINADNMNENLFSYIRKGSTSDIVVILNMSPNTYRKHAFGVLKAGSYMEILNTDQDIYAGSNIVNPQTMKAVKAECDHLPYHITVDVAGFGGVMLEVKKRTVKKATAKTTKKPMKKTTEKAVKKPIKKASTKKS